MVIFLSTLILAILLSLLGLGFYSILLLIRVFVKCYKDKQLSFWSEFPKGIFLWIFPVVFIVSYSIYLHFDDGFGNLNDNFLDRKLDYEFDSSRSFHGDGYSSRLWNVSEDKPTELELLESCPFETEMDQRYKHFCWKPIDSRFYELYSSTKSLSENSKIEERIDEYLQKSNKERVWYSFTFLNSGSYISDLELLIYFETVDKLVYINFNT